MTAHINSRNLQGAIYCPAIGTKKNRKTAFSLFGLPGGRRVTIVLAILLSCILISSCSRFNKEPDYENETAEELYAIAKTQMSKKNWETSLEILRKLEAKYPYGVYAEQAQLDTVYAYYQSDQPGLAIAAADRFIKLHPTHRSVDYAYYLKGLASFSEDNSFWGVVMGHSDLSDRDSNNIRDAKAAFEEVIILFPNSDYANDAKFRVRHLENALASNEISIANYYYTRKAYVAVVNRAKGVIENYSTTPSVEQALALMLFSYQHMGFEDLASDVHRVLELNYPKSAYLDQTKEEVRFANKHSPKADQPKKEKKGWFSSWFGKDEEKVEPAS